MFKIGYEYVKRKNKNICSDITSKGWNYSGAESIFEYNINEIYQVNMVVTRVYTSSK